MLRLGTVDRKKTHPVLLAGGAVLHVRRVDSIVYYSAEAATGRMLQAIAGGQSVLDDLGIDDEIAALEDSETAFGLSALVFAVELAVRCIDHWEGVGDAEGNPIEPDRKSIAMLFSADPTNIKAFEAVALATPHDNSGADVNADAAEEANADG